MMYRTFAISAANRTTSSSTPTIVWIILASVAAFLLWKLMKFLFSEKDAPLPKNIE